MLWTLRVALTRDDVRYRPKNGLMACEYVEMRRNKPPPIRKWAVYNQKYETPPGLIKALREPTEEEWAQMQAEKEEKAKEDAKKK